MDLITKMERFFLIFLALKNIISYLDSVTISKSILKLSQLSYILLLRFSYFWFTHKNIIFKLSLYKKSIITDYVGLESVTYNLKLKNIHVLIRIKIFYNFSKYRVAHQKSTGRYNCEEKNLARKIWKTSSSFVRRTTFEKSFLSIAFYFLNSFYLWRRYGPLKWR